VALVLLIVFATWATLVHTGIVDIGLCHLSTEGQRSGAELG
jgi:hypothetical protein